MRRCALGEADAGFAAELVEAAQELRSREDRCGGNGGIALGARHLHQLNLAPALEQRVANQRLISELVRDRGRGIGRLLDDVLDHARVRPGEEAVDVAELLPQLVVARWHDRQNFVRERVANFACDPQRAVVGKVLAVLHTQFDEDAPVLLRQRDGGHDERAEVVALTALVAANPAGRVSQHRLDRRAGALARLHVGRFARNERSDRVGMLGQRLVEDDLAAAAL